MNDFEKGWMAGLIVGVAFMFLMIYLISLKP
jgi:uncharacterized protein YoxC